VCILSVHREGQFIGDGLTGEPGTRIQEPLHRRCCAIHNSRQGQHQRLPATGGITANMKKILDRKA